MQDIDQKKTMLEDDASIYQKREEREESKSVKEKWSQLDAKGKWHFFVDYYLLKLLLVLFFGGIIISLLYTTFKHKPEELSYIALLDSKLNSVAVEEFFETAVVDMGLDPKDYTIFCNSSLASGTAGDGTTISTYMFAGTIDFFIAPADALATYYNAKTLLALDLELPADIKASLTEEDYFYAVSPVDNQSHIFGICLDGTPFMEKTNLYESTTTYYLAVTVNGANVLDGDCWRVIRYILGLPQVAPTPTVAK